MMIVSQSWSCDGLTQASSVIPLVRSIGLAVVSATVTQSSMPSNDRALPNLPATCRAPRTVPFFATTDESAATRPVVSSNPNAATRPSAPSETTTPTALPGATAVPAIGEVLLMLPVGIVALFAKVIVPTAKPTPVSAVVAAARVWPTTLGTVFCTTPTGPSEIWRATALPGATFDPATSD